MPQQFSQEPIYEESKPQLWCRILVPIFVVICAGAAAYYIGQSTSTQMTTEIQKMDVREAQTSLLQKSVIGDDEPEIMVSSPLPTPAQQVILVQNNDEQSHKAAKPSDSQKKAPSAVSPFDDNSIPFRPAEDYTPGVEHENLPNLPNVQAPDNGEIKTPLPDLQAPREATNSETSPVPVPESSAASLN